MSPDEGTACETALKQKVRVLELKRIPVWLKRQRAQGSWRGGQRPGLQGLGGRGKAFESYCSLLSFCFYYSKRSGREAIRGF